MTPSLPRGTRRATLAAAARGGTVALAVALASAAQGTWPPGFAAAVLFTDTTHVTSVSGVLGIAGDRHLLIQQNDVYVVGSSFAPAPAGAQRPMLTFAGEDIAFLVPDGQHVFVGGLRSGRIVRCTIPSGTVVAQLQGVANVFDAILLPGGSLLLNANPLWPGPGATTGLWLATTGAPPRPLLPLVGPSGPIALAANGDLVVGELGPIVPPPPGASRLLRIPAARLQQALAGGTLTMADVGATGTGWLGIYDVAALPDGRLLVSDAASSQVLTTAPGGLSPAGVWLDAGPGTFVTNLQLVGASHGPLRGWLPPEHAAELRVLRSDFFSLLEVARIAPRRPLASIAPSAVVAPGTSTLQVDAAPPNGAVAWFAGASLPGGELHVLTLDGQPLWLGLQPAGIVPLGLATTDGLGTSTFALHHAGGVGGAVSCQAVAFGVVAGEFGSAQRLDLQLVP
jgi:hypothetical protein